MKKVSAAEFRKLIEDKGKVAAVAHFVPCQSEKAAEAYIFQYVQKLLASGQYGAAALVLWGDTIFDPRPYSVRAVWRGIQRSAKRLIQGAGSAGKSYTVIAWLLLDWWRDPEFTTIKIISTTAGHCFAPGTMVRMYDGTTKPVEKIEAGDLLMGPDSKARKVLETHSGEDEMFHVKPFRTAGFVCNQHHLLHLEQTIDSPERWKKLGEKRNVSIRNYVSSSGTFKNEFKMVRQGFELAPKPQSFDPYIVGLWLGDGNTDAPALTTMDPPVRDRWCEYFLGLGYKIKAYGKKGNKASTYFARMSERGDGSPSGRGVKSNPFTSFIRASCRDENGKRIPKEILRSSRKHRLECLAGLVDSDGANNQRGYLISTKFPRLKDDILDLCSSLGFHASAVEFFTKDKPYWRINIRGKCEEVPVLLDRKKCEATNTRQRPVGFDIHPVGRGEYFGFEVDGDNLFLLASGLVAHNSKSNTFSTMVMLHKAAIVKMPGKINSGFIGLDSNDKRACISIVAIPAGDNGNTRLQGFHPIPRPKDHPTLGKLSRVRAFIDEAEGVPIGLWFGVKNMLLNMDGPETIKVIAAYNPKDPASKVAQIAEPEGGWEANDMDVLKEWVSKENWPVTRIDAVDIENVKERKMIYHGLQTYEGFRELELTNGGNSPEYFTFGRGWYSPNGANDTIVSSELFLLGKGEFVFTGKTTRYAGVDTALEGGDNAVMTIGRYGLASEFIRHVLNVSTKEIQRVRIPFSEPRHVAQVDQQIVLKKGKTEVIATQIRDNCKAAGVDPAHCCIDATGNGSSVLGLLRAPSFWSPDVQGVDFSQAATDNKILEQDQKTPEEEFEGVVTEVWFALRRWLEFTYLAIHPGVRQDPLTKEIIGRKYKVAELRKLKVEKKKDYIGRLGNSPDFADSLTVFLHGIRMRTGATASSTGQKEENKRPLGSRPHGIVDNAMAGMMDEMGDDGI